MVEGGSLENCYAVSPHRGFKSPPLRKGVLAVMKVFLYVIRSKVVSKRYVGVTSDLKRRLKEHASRRTKGGQVLGDFELVLVEEFQSYSEARVREKFLKSGQGRKWLDETLKPGLARGE